MRMRTRTRARIGPEHDGGRRVRRVKFTVKSFLGDSRHCQRRVITPSSRRQRRWRGGRQRTPTPPRRHDFHTGDDMCRDDCRTVVARLGDLENFRHLAGTKAKARWNATTTGTRRRRPTTRSGTLPDDGYYRGRKPETGGLAGRRGGRAGNGRGPVARKSSPGEKPIQAQGATRVSTPRGVPPRKSRPRAA